MAGGHVLLSLAAAGFLCTACAGADSVRLPPGADGQALQADSQSALALDVARTRPLGRGAAFHPGPLGNPAVAAARPVAAGRCTSSAGSDYGAHIELFAEDHEVLVPAGIGIAPPQHRAGPFVRGGRCRYPLATVDPTGVIRVKRRRGARPTLGQLFALWGQSLSRRRLAGFAGPVIAYVDGRRWIGDPRSIPLSRHAQIVLALRAHVQPHPFYLFPPGL